MEIEHLFRYPALAVGLKPSASQGEARLRGLERIIYSKTIISVAVWRRDVGCGHPWSVQPCPTGSTIVRTATICHVVSLAGADSIHTDERYGMTVETKTNGKPQVNRIGLTSQDYRGGETTLCQGCGHNSITSQIIAAAFELSLAPHQVIKMSGIGCSSKNTGILHEPFIRLQHAAWAHAFGDDWSGAGESHPCWQSGSAVMGTPAVSGWGSSSIWCAVTSR
jgi:hypothetical protein